MMSYYSFGLESIITNPVIIKKYNKEKEGLSDENCLE